MISPSVVIGQHEMFHSLGVLHEQHRPDRDEYVTVRFSNIQSGFAHNFRKMDDTNLDILFTGEYDFNSIMHYRPFSFSWNGEPTITRKDGSTDFGNAPQMSTSDLEHINRLYPEPVNDCEDLVRSRTIAYEVDYEMPKNDQRAYCPNQEIKFTVSDSQRPLQLYRWEAEEGAPSTGSGKSFAPSFDSPGRKEIVLTVTWGVQERREVFEVFVEEISDPIRVFGNPLGPGDNIRFEVKSDTPDYSVLINNALGQTLFLEEVRAATCHKTFEFPSGNLTPEVYSICFLRGNKFSSKQLVIN